MIGLADFAGSWRLDRLILDRAAGSEGAFTGTAVLRPPPGRTAAEALTYREEGILRLGSGPGLTARRDYLWEAAGDAIAVSFADGRPFHRFTAAAPAARHLCGADDYRVCYDFATWPDWQAEWTVAGPRKDYTLLSRYRRTGA